MDYQKLVEEMVSIPSIPEWVAVKFAELGEQQRDAPEIAMVRAQHAIGGGVMSPVIEHGGDLVHRATHMLPGSNNALWYLADEKINKVHRMLFSPYGFERENEENMRANVQYYFERDGRTYEEHKADIDSKLLAYAQEHSKLPAYNQYHADCREMCVAVGEQRFDIARIYCDSLYRLIKNRARFEKAVREYREASPGELRKL